MRKILSAVILIAYLAVLTYFSLIPGLEGPSFGVSSIDKLYHFLAYFGLSVVLLFVFDSFKIRQVWLVYFLSFLYGLLLEMGQQYVPFRVFDLFDLLANFFGAFGAIIFSKVIKGRLAK